MLLVASKVASPEHGGKTLVEWTARQLLQAFPWDNVPRYLLRDRDSICGEKYSGGPDCAAIPCHHCRFSRS